MLPHVAVAVIGSVSISFVSSNNSPTTLLPTTTTSPTTSPPTSDDDDDEDDDDEDDDDDTVVVVVVVVAFRLLPLLVAVPKALLGLVLVLIVSVFVFVLLKKRIVMTIFREQHKTAAVTKRRGFVSIVFESRDPISCEVSGQIVFHQQKHEPSRASNVRASAHQTDVRGFDGGHTQVVVAFVVLECLFSLVQHPLLYGYCRGHLRNFLETKGARRLRFQRIFRARRLEILVDVCCVTCNVRNGNDDITLGTK